MNPGKDRREKDGGFVRTFIAIELPDGVKTAISDVQAELIKTGAHVGWTRTEGVHLTLKFLGDVAASRIDELARAVGDAARGTGQIKLGVSGIGVFPNERNPRVVWLGLTGDLDRLRSLYEKLDAACEKLGFKREDRPFKPHLTLGRVKSPGGRDKLMRTVTALSDVTSGSFTADSVSVMKSELRPSGAVYTELARVGL